MYQVSFFVSTTPSLSGAAAGQAAENQGGQHEDEQHREHEQDCGSGEKLLAMLCGIQSGPRRRAIGSAYRRALSGGGDGLAGFDSATNGLRSAGRLGQAAFFLVVQFWILLSCELVVFLL